MTAKNLVLAATLKELYLLSYSTETLQQPQRWRSRAAALDVRQCAYIRRMLNPEFSAFLKKLLLK